MPAARSRSAKRVELPGSTISSASARQQQRRRRAGRDMSRSAAFQAGLAAENDLSAFHRAAAGNHTVRQYRSARQCRGPAPGRFFAARPVDRQHRRDMGAGRMTHQKDLVADRRRTRDIILGPAHGARAVVEKIRVTDFRDKSGSPAARRHNRAAPAPWRHSGKGACCRCASRRHRKRRRRAPPPRFAAGRYRACAARPAHRGTSRVSTVRCGSDHVKSVFARAQRAGGGYDHGPSRPFRCARTVAAAVQKNLAARYCLAAPRGRRSPSPSPPPDRARRSRRPRRNRRRHSGRADD